MALEELGAQGTDLTEMVQVSYFILRRREKEEKMGQDPILRLPRVAHWRILRGNLRRAEEGMMRRCMNHMSFTLRLRLRQKVRVYLVF